MSTLKSTQGRILTLLQEIAIEKKLGTFSSDFDLIPILDDQAKPQRNRLPTLSARDIMLCDY